MTVEKNKINYDTWKPENNLNTSETLAFNQGQEYLNYRDNKTKRLKKRSEMLTDVNGFNKNHNYEIHSSIKNNKSNNEKLIREFNKATKKTNKNKSFERRG